MSEMPEFYPECLSPEQSSAESISILNLLNRDPRLRVRWAAGNFPKFPPRSLLLLFVVTRASPTWCEVRIPSQTLVSLLKEAEYGVEEHDVISLLCGI